MENKHIKSFWVGFAFTVALTAWVYWLLRQKRVVAPEPLVVSGKLRSQTPLTSPPPVVKKQPLPVSDALEEIKGIGPIFANRLNAAGILTFEQLAATPADELTRITGVTRWDPADWIAEATELAAGQ
ncbi:MAG: helix-hairpin-helix domain-containing protein [Chloroflexota bacterium]|jgi:predicted flap endonuclease-1-like 5' DNA nuclease